MQVIEVCLIQVCVRRLVFVCTSVLKKVWTVDLVSACKAFRVAREPVRIRKQYYRSHCRSWFTLSQWSGLATLQVEKQRPAFRPHKNPTNPPLARQPSPPTNLRVGKLA